jgi:predicted transcriptional regulator of viral defense system
MLFLDVGRERVATHAELVGAGIPLSTVTSRIQPGGRWQRLLPGVVVMHTGQPSKRERLIGALAYAGPDAVLSGMAGLELHGMRGIAPGAVQVLVPHERRRQSHGFVIVERTRLVPEGSAVRELAGLPTADLARCVVDACRRIEDLNAVRNLVSAVVQNHGLAPSALADALRHCARQRSALSRLVLAEINAGVRFAAEARAREVLRDAGLPEPLFNVELMDDAGRVFAVPDGYFPEWACGYQVDSRRWHLSPQDYERTTRQRGYAGRFGVMILAVTPQRIFEDPDGFVADVRGLIETARSRTAPIIAFRTREGR